MPWPTPNVLGSQFDAKFGRWGGPQNWLYSPTQLPDLSAWFDALDTQTMLAGDGNIVTDGGTVCLWKDKSGNSGVNALCFNGGYTAGTNYAGLSGLAAFGTGDLTIVIDLKWSDASATKVALGGAANSLQVNVNTNGTVASAITGGAANTASSGALTVFSRATVTYVRSGTTGTYYFNGAAGGTTTDSKDYSAAITRIGDSFAIGSTNTWAGTIYAVRAYSAALDAAGVLADYGGTVQANCILNANFALACQKLANGDAFTATTGGTVTLNSSGATGARIAGERDLFQGTAANRPVYLAYSGTKYGWLNGTSGNNFSTPDSAATSLTLNADLIWDGSLDD